MKKKLHYKKRFSNLCFVILTALTTAFAQSGKTIEPTVIAPVQEAAPDIETKIEIPKPKAMYEYVAPQPIVEFMLALKEAGKRGFRLNKVTALPSGAADTSREKANQTVLAGILRFDGEIRYDYNFFFAEGGQKADDRLNGLSRNGWYFRDVVSVYGSGIDSNPLFDNTVYNLPTFGNLYLLERVTGEEKPAPNYKLLKAGVSLGRSPTEKMQGLLDEAVTDGYAPLATYFAFEIKSLFSVDSFVGVLLGKNVASEKRLYKFVRANRSEGLQKEIDVLSKQGWRIRSVNFNSAILTRDDEKSAPVNYQWLRTDEKTYPATLAATLLKQPLFVTSGIDMSGDGTYVKNILIFEHNPTFLAAYQFARMQRIVPKQFKKNPQDYLKTFEPGDVAFKRLLDQGNVPRDLYYSAMEGLSVVFESAK